MMNAVDFSAKYPGNTERTWRYMRNTDMYYYIMIGDSIQVGQIIYL